MDKTITKKNFAQFLQNMKEHPLFEDKKVTDETIEKYYSNYVESKLSFDVWRRITFGP